MKDNNKAMEDMTAELVTYRDELKVREELLTKMTEENR
jgi:hypothetical protein